jgi:hypothetical protein
MRGVQRLASGRSMGVPGDDRSAATGGSLRRMRDDVLEPAPVRIGSNEALSIDLTQEFVCSGAINR